MYNTSVSYLLKATDPYTSNVNFPIKYFQIPLVVANYPIRYSPVSLHPSLLMFDYLVGSRESKLSQVAENEMVETIREQFEADEFVVLEGSKTSEEGYVHSLVTFNRPNKKNAVTGDFKAHGERDTTKDLDVLQKFHSAWRTSKKLTIQQAHAADRDKTHGISIQQSISFLRDRVKGLGIALPELGLRDLEQEAENSYLMYGLRDQVQKVEISHVLGADRDYVRGMVKVSTELALRDYQHTLSKHFNHDAERESIKGLQVSHSIALAERPKVFGMVQQFLNSGERPIQSVGEVTWSHIVAERIIDADATIQQTLLLAERVNSKDGSILHGQYKADLQNLRNTVIMNSLNSGRLKARSYPAHVAFNLLKSDRVIARATQLLKNSQFTRDATGKLALQHLDESVRLIKQDLTLGLLGKSVRHKSTDMTVNQGLLGSSRDKVSALYLHNQVVESVRDITDTMVVNYSLRKADRDRIHDGAIVFGNLKEAYRSIAHDMTAPFTLGTSNRIIGSQMNVHEQGLLTGERIITNDAVVTLENLTGDRIITSDTVVTLGNTQFKRDITSSLYVPEQPIAEREKTSSLYLSEGEAGRKETNRPLLLHTFTPAEREHVKDLLLSFIGDYVRKNYHDMTGVANPKETVDGGSIPPSIYDGILMDDEIIAELVDDFAMIIETMYLGEVDRPLEGSLLAEKMLATREKIDGFLNQGVLQGTGENSEGIILFNTEHLMASTKRSGLYSEGDAGQRIDPTGIVGDSVLGTRPDVYGAIGESSIAAQPDKQGIDLGDYLAGDYGHSASEEDALAFGYINASPADFLTAEELAQLQARDGQINEGVSMGQVDSREGYTSYVELLGKSLNFEKPAFLEKDGYVELLGLRPISEGHLLDEMQLGKLVKLELHGIIHETIEGTFLTERKGVYEDADFLGERVDSSAAVTLDDWFVAVKEGIGHLEEGLSAGILKSRDGFIDTSNTLATKEPQPFRFLDTVESIKASSGFIVESDYTGVILKDGLLDKDIQAVKEEVIYLHELLVSGLPERYFVESKLELFDKYFLDSTLEEGHLTADQFEKTGYVENDLLGGRFGKQADYETSADNMLTGYTYRFGTVEGGSIEGTGKHPTEFGNVTDDLPQGVRPDPHGFVTDLHYMGTRTDPFGIINTEIKLGTHVTDRPGYVISDNVLGTRPDFLDAHLEVLSFKGSLNPDLRGSTVLNEFIVGERRFPQGGFVEESSFLGINLKQGVALEGTHLLGTSDKEGTVEQSLLAKTNGKNGSLEQLSLAQANGKNGSVEQSLLAQTNGKNGSVEQSLLAKTNGKVAAVEDMYLADKNPVSGSIETLINSIKEKLSVIEQGLVGLRDSRVGYVETDSVVVELNQKDSIEYDDFHFGQLHERTGHLDKSGYTSDALERNSYQVESSLISNRQEAEVVVIDSFTTGVKKRLDGTQTESTPVGRLNESPAIVVDDSVDVNVLQRYGVTEAHLMEAEKLKWVGILTNLLFADEEKGHSYVDYLMDAGVIKPDHYHLLNGLVGDLAEKKGLAFGQEFVVGLKEQRAELIENLQGQGLIYNYDDASAVLEKGMEIEDWDLNLGYGLPENYDPYDPFNSFYPYLLDNYDVSSLSLQQLEDWKSFGGTNWQADGEHGYITSVEDNDSPNGYVLNNYNSASYKFSVNFRVSPEDTDQDGVGVVFKYMNELNYYKFVITGGPANSIKMGNTFMQLYRVKNGAQQPMGSAMSPEPWVKGEWFNIRVSYVDKHLQIWVNDRLQYDMIDY